MSLLWELIHNADSDRWHRQDMVELSLRQLQLLAALWACPKSGTKESLTVRLLAIRSLRQKLSRYQDDPTPLATAYSRIDLRHFAKEAGLWRSGTKRQLAAVLLMWRNRCRLNGRKVMDEITAAVKDLPVRPEQLELSVDLQRQIRPVRLGRTASLAAARKHATPLIEQSLALPAQPQLLLP